MHFPSFTDTTRNNRGSISFKHNRVALLRSAANLDNFDGLILASIKVGDLNDPMKRVRPAGAVLPEWPTVDDAVVLEATLHLLTFDLDPTTLSTDILCHLAKEMFVSAGLPAGLATDRVSRFILAVRASMLDNPYHNFYHVFDVMQTTNALATSTGTMTRLDSWERFALLSAALW
jgi:hypothetical protein